MFRPCDWVITSINGHIATDNNLNELFATAKELQVPYEVEFQVCSDQYFPTESVPRKRYGLCASDSNINLIGLSGTI